MSTGNIATGDNYFPRPADEKNYGDTCQMVLMFYCLHLDGWESLH